jgi:hypothetical protein
MLQSESDRDLNVPHGLGLERPLPEFRQSRFIPMVAASGLQHPRSGNFAGFVIDIHQDDSSARPSVLSSHLQREANNKASQQ